MTPVAEELAAWATALEPSADDVDLAGRSLVDTIAVAVAARDDAIRDLLGELPESAAWATLAHVSTSTTCTCRRPRTSARSACPRS